MDATCCFMKYTSGFSFVKFERMSSSFIFGAVVAVNNCFPKACCETIVALLIHLFCTGKKKRTNIMRNWPLMFAPRVEECGKRPETGRGLFEQEAEGG